MTEKRFTAIPETVSYKDNLTGERLCPKREKDYYAVLNKMNKLSEENKQLKQQLNEMIDIFADCGLSYVLSDELEDILND